MVTSEEKRQALQARIRDSHPAVYLTLVSIIVALALDDLLSIASVNTSKPAIRGRVKTGHMAAPETGVV